MESLTRFRNVLYGPSHGHAPPLPLKRGRGTSAQVEAASLWAAPLPVRPDRSLLLLAMSEVHFSDPGGTRGPLDWRFPGGRE